MKFPALFRNTLLLSGLFVLGLASAVAADWPRQVTDSRGVHTLESKPTRIVSTSVTLTGSLLAIDAPVVASGATTPNNRVADAQGFLRQWGDIAKQRKVARLYIGEPSAEAVAAQMPDLILISATGGDSALALYDQLSAIAPTLIINYDDKSWQELLTQLGTLTGQEKQAAERIAAFDKQLAQVKQQMKLPPQPVNAIVYTAAAHSASVMRHATGRCHSQAGVPRAAPYMRAAHSPSTTGGGIRHSSPLGCTSSGTAVSSGCSERISGRLSGTGRPFHARGASTHAWPPRCVRPPGAAACW